MIYSRPLINLQSRNPFYKAKNLTRLDRLITGYNYSWCMVLFSCNGNSLDRGVKFRNGTITFARKSEGVITFDKNHGGGGV